MAKKPAIEIRNDQLDELDEIVATGAEIHLERMSKGHWWMIVSKGKQSVVVNFYTTKNAKIKAMAERDDSK